MKREQLNQKHSEWHGQAWADIDLLAVGGHKIKGAAATFLTQRPAEPGDTYARRVGRFTYQNILGTCLEWYQSRMADDAPTVRIKGVEKTRAEDAGGAGVSLHRLLAGDRGLISSITRYGCGWVLVDLPRTDRQFSSLAEQRSAGVLTPFARIVHPASVLDWSDDFAVLYEVEEERTPGRVAEFDRWTVYTRTDYEIWRARRGDAAAEPTLFGSDRHALAEVGQLPLRRWCGPWLADRAILPVRDHINADNALSWCLFMACLPVPVIKGDFKAPPVISETSAIRLDEGGDFSYAEPSGVSYVHAAARVASLREEIYRCLYLSAQSRSESATASATSGESKRLDMAHARPVLAALGEIARDAGLAILRDLAAVEGSTIEASITGYDFPDEDTTDKMAEAKQALDLGIPSDTFTRTVLARLARAILEGEDPAILAAVDSEIAASPSMQERRAAALASTRDRLLAAVA